MKRLKIILSCKYFYIILLLISLLFCYFKVRNNYSSKYKSIDSIIVKVENISFNKKYKLLLSDMKGEKIIAYTDISVDVGDVLKINGSSIEFNKVVLPNNFDYEKYLCKKNIFHVINIASLEVVSKNKSILNMVKNKVLRRSLLANNSYSYLQYFLFQDNSYIDDSILDSYRNLGIVHLFSVSGLHLSYFVKFLKKVFKYNFIVLIILGFYLFLINFSVSFFRAYLFYIFILVYKRLNIKIEKYYILMLVCSLFIFYNPFIVYDLGFMFSFSISFSLLFLSRYLRGNYIKSSFYVSLVAFLVSFPIVISNFYQVNVNSIIFNLFFVPLVSYVIFPVSFIVYFVPGLDNVLYTLILFMNKMVLFFSDYSFYIVFGKPSLLFIFVYYLLIIILYRFLFDYKKIFYLFLFIMFLVFSFCLRDKSDYYLMGNVDNGDMSVIVVDEMVNVIDTGGKYSKENSKYSHYYAYSLINYLKSKGYSRIENLIISHGDLDHMGDAIYLVQNFKVSRVIFNVGEYNELEKKLISILDEKEIKYYKNLETLKVGKYKFQFLNTRIYDNENDNSNVIYFNYNNYRFLFMGDAGKMREKDILDKYKLDNIDFLKVGHHGSDTSSSKMFIDTIKPKYSLISVGKNNRYNHPKDSVLEVLNDSKVYRTDLDGCVEIKLNRNGYKIRKCF